MKVGLVALSGVRAQNPDLTRLGLTLPGFVERGKVVASLPSLSLLTLAGLTPARFTLDYREVSAPHERAALPDDYELVAISSFSAQIREAYALGDHYLAKGIPVVLGGLHVSALPEEAKPHCTSVVVGEGEPLWPRVLADCERGALAPFYVQSPRGAFDLADSPMPRFDLLDPARYDRITVQTSRGCPWRCDFCASSILLTPRYKVKPLPKVLAEIRAIKEVWPRPFIEFADDNSFVSHRRDKELLRALVRERIRWFTETDISVAEDDELLGLLRDSGCKQVLIGLESPRRASLDRLELNANWKVGRLDRYRRAIARVQSYGITVNGCFILGLDGDTPEVFSEVFDFVRDSGLYEVQITFMTAFPGTPLYQRLRAAGRILREDAWELCTLFDVNFRPQGMTAAELHQGFLGLAEKLYSRREVDARRRGFRSRLRESPARRRARR